METLLDNVGWYQRIENNGWRPVAYTHLLQANIDNYFSAVNEKPVHFPHTKVCFFVWFSWMKYVKFS